MKRDCDVRRNRISGRYILGGGIMAVMLSVSLPVRAQVVQTADAESAMEAMLFAQDTSDTELQMNQIQQVEDSTELDAEFARLEEESIMIVEEVERQREEARRSKIWGAVIVVLVMAIFVMGILSTVTDKKAENMENTEKEPQGEKNRWLRKQKGNQSEDIEIEDTKEIKDIEIEEIKEIKDIKIEIEEITE